MPRRNRSKQSRPQQAGEIRDAQRMQRRRKMARDSKARKQSSIVQNGGRWS